MESLDKLHSLNLSELISVQRYKGRAELPSDFLDHWSSIHTNAKLSLSHTGYSATRRRLISLLYELTYPIYAVKEKSSGERLKYYQYSDVAVIQWYIGNKHVPFRRIKARSLKGIQSILTNLHDFESRSVFGSIKYSKLRFDNEVAIDRIKKLTHTNTIVTTLLENIGVAANESSTTEYSNLGDYVFEEQNHDGMCLSVLAHLMAFPQTQYHDEIIFMRTIHIAELCFFLLQIIFIEAIEAIQKCMYSAARAALTEAVQVVDILLSIFRALRTMPDGRKKGHNHFADFRDYTENASAIQSKGYQLLDVVYRGVDIKKAEIIGSGLQPFLNSLSSFAHPNMISLRSVISDEDYLKGANDDEKDGITHIARQIDRKLLTWRRIHLGFALAYLPPAQPGTGETAGAAYLEKFIEEGKLFSDTASDSDLLQDMFPDIGVFRPGSEIAPSISERTGV